MVFLTLLDLSLSSTIWIAKNTFYAGRYLIYGRQKTKEEIIEEKEEEILKKLEKMEKIERVILNSQINLIPGYNPNSPDNDTHNDNNDDVPQVVNRRKSI